MRPNEFELVARFARRVRINNMSSGQTLLVADGVAADDVPIIALSELDDTFLDKLRPAIIVTPLVSVTFDALDVAESLFCAGFTGELVVMAANLPHPHVVEKELRDIAPGLRVTLSVSNRSNAPH